MQKLFVDKQLTRSKNLENFEIIPFIEGINVALKYIKRIFNNMKKYQN